MRSVTDHCAPQRSVGLLRLQQRVNLLSMSEIFMGIVLLGTWK